MGFVEEMEMDKVDPYLTITEQPVDKFRFRYKSEMHGTHGSLTGSGTNRSRKSYPSVQLLGFSGIAIIRCSLYQARDLNKCLHSHSLVVRRDNDDCKDPHDVQVSPASGYTAMYVEFGGKKWRNFYAFCYTVFKAWALFIRPKNSLSTNCMIS